MTNEADTPTKEEIDEAWCLLALPLGEPWSGRARYAAATTLHAAGLIDEGVLEVYRMVSRLDLADPLALIGDFGLEAPQFLPACRP